MSQVQMSLYMEWTLLLIRQKKKVQTTGKAPILDTAETGERL